MKPVPRVVPEPLPVPVITPAGQAVELSIEAGHAIQGMSEVPVYYPGPIPCRCGRYFSEDFNGRLFCRGCEGTDSADITPRLPLYHRPQ
jgi:hypothetical protein